MSPVKDTGYFCLLSNPSSGKLFFPRPQVILVAILVGLYQAPVPNGNRRGTQSWHLGPLAAVTDPGGKQARRVGPESFSGINMQVLRQRSFF